MSGGTITGTDELFKNLKKLPEKVRVSIAVGATRKVAVTIAKEAQANVPVDTGALKLSIATVKRKEKYGDTTYIVVPRRKRKVKVNGIKGQVSGWYAHFIEFGTVNQPAHPFLRPAYENIGPNAAKIYTIYGKKRFDKEMSKL